jgi:hypothetical protein
VVCERSNVTDFASVFDLLVFNIWSNLFQ